MPQFRKYQTIGSETPIGLIPPFALEILRLVTFRVNCPRPQTVILTFSIFNLISFSTK